MLVRFHSMLDRSTRFRSVSGPVGSLFPYVGSVSGHVGSLSPHVGSLSFNVRSLSPYIGSPHLF